MITKQNIFRIIHWSLTTFIIFYMITGFGITAYQIVTPLTFGILSKPVAFQLHTTLIYPFILLLCIHMLVTIKKKRRGFKKHD